MTRNDLPAAALAAALSCTCPCPADPSSFTGLGQLPGGVYGSNAVAISGDGQAVVGTSDDGSGGYWTGYRWTRDGGMTPLPPNFWPADVSAGGTVVVGTSHADSQAARWTQTAGLELLGTLNGDARSSAAGVSADGETIVGTSTRVELLCCDRWGRPYYAVTEQRGFVLASSGQMRALHPPAPSFLYTSVKAISADGAVIAGTSGPGHGPAQACIWRDRHATEIGQGDACAISADGSVVIGYAGNDVFRWTEADGMQGLCWPGPLSYTRPLATSADGGVIIGNNEYGAMIWDAADGARLLKDALVHEYGLDLDGWTLHAAVDVSDDGRTIVGTGTNPGGQQEAWIAVLGDRLPPCPGDFNSDSAIDLSDLATLLGHFGTASGATYADGDLNVDGDVDLGDLAVLLAHFGATCPGDPVPNLTGLGFLPAGYVSQCYGVSADGAVVVGTGYVRIGEFGYDHRAFRWTETGGMVDLGTLPGGSRAEGFAVSADGSVVVGVSNSASGWFACRWTNDGLLNLGTLPGGYGSTAWGVSGNGAVIVGSADTGGNSNAFRWTSGDGMVSLGTLPGATTSGALAVSADGSTVVGGCYFPGGSERAFRWTSVEGMEDLGALPGFESSLALAANEDGSVIVGVSGYYGYTNDRFAFRWTRAGGMVSLGALPGDTSSSARSVSADGSMVLGASHGTGGARWFLWTAPLGMVDLSTLVVAPADWWPALGGTAISADGLTVVGTGTHCGRTEAWIARLAP